MEAAGRRRVHCSRFHGLAAPSACGCGRARSGGGGRALNSGSESSLQCYGASLKSRHYAWKRQEQKDLKVLFELSLDPRSKSKGGFKNGYRQVLESVLDEAMKKNSCDGYMSFNLSDAHYEILNS
ncbi:hypothetical protein OsI_28721 [Oryza sativa Indica Group]|uniref:Uncharacterized protein n=1 Tax=Oryza sativa subsp. indica TaxID=39946 RepID=A2YTS2_ORYSI|nr:hypothetical protein OsI_28721 [Oryza sativa Indica Group]